MLIEADKSVLVIIDAQAGLMPKIAETGRVTSVINKLIAIARELDVPMIVTEHYPEGLKATVPEIAGTLGGDYKPIVKRIFSCYGAKDFRRALESTNRRQLLLAGIETHICVLQTALQCLEAGYAVFVAADGVGARGRVEHEIGLDRMRRAGAEPITWEMAAYEWMRRADTPAFKKVLPHIKSGLGPA